MTQENEYSRLEVFPATVVLILSSSKIVINRGKVHGLRAGQRLLVYQLSEQEIIDPSSKESLGQLEIVKGTGKVIHLQEKMSTIESDKKQMRRISKSSNNIYGIGSDVVESEENVLPFESPEVGDMVKPI